MRTRNACFVAVGLCLAGCAGPSRVGPVVSFGPAGYLRIDGEPFFPLEIYGASSDEDLSILDWIGFNTVIEGKYPVDRESLAHDFRWVSPHWFNAGFDQKEARRLVAQRAAWPQLIAWNLHDEPDVRHVQAPPEALAMAAQLIREHDPFGRPTSVTLSGAAGGLSHWPGYSRAVDILRIDPYPVLRGKPLATLIERLADARSQGQGDRPVWTVLQAWGAPRMPTARQHRVLAYLALVGGTRGLSWFDFNFRTWRDSPAMFNAVIAMVHELRAMAPVLLGGHPVLVTTPAPSVHVRALRHAGRLYVWAVNPTDAPVSCEIRLPPCEAAPTSPEPTRGRFANARAVRTVRTVFDKSLWDDGGRSFALAGSRFVLDLGPIGAKFLAIGPAGPAPAPVKPIIAPVGVVQLVERYAPGHYLLKNTSDEPVEATVALAERPGEAAYELDIAGRPMGPVPLTRDGVQVRLTCRPQTFYEVGSGAAVFEARRRRLVEALDRHAFTRDVARRLRRIDARALEAARAPDAMRHVYWEVLMAAVSLEGKREPRAKHLARGVRDLAHLLAGVDVRLDGIYSLERGWDSPAHRQRAFAGATCRLRVEARARGIIDPADWGVRFSRDDTLEPYPSVRAVALPERSRTRREYDVTLPEGLDGSRDHVLRAEVHYGFGLHRNGIVRKVRFQVDPPFDVDVALGPQADRATRFTVRLTSRFKGYRFGRLRLGAKSLPRGWSATVDELTRQPDGGRVASLLLQATSAPLWATFQPVFTLMEDERLRQELPLPRVMVDPQGRLFAGADAARRALCMRTATPPVVDGGLDDACWRAAAPVVGMMELGTTRLSPVQTVARFAYDATHLYMAAEVFGIEPKAIRAEAAKRDEWRPGDDRISLMLTPEPTGTGYYFVGLTATGRTFDLQTGPHPATGQLYSKVNWDPKARVATARTATGWRVELALPLADLGRPPVDARTRWRMNIRYGRGIAPRQTTSWNHNPTWEPDPARFGILEFR